MATQALGQALKTNMSKPPKMTAGETYMQSVEPTLKELKGAEEDKMKAEKEKAIFTGESESRRQQALAKATEAEATAMREDPARAQYGDLIQEKAKAEFIPSQENAQDMAALFSLMNVIGFAIGAGGKAHAQQAMSAMNGMLEGHQKGRDDLYKQQKNIFETNQKQLDKKIDDLYKFMQENTKLYARDKVAAEQNANAKFAEEGAGFLKTYYEKYGPGPALEYMKQVVKAKEHAADLTDKERTRAEQQAFRLQQAAIAAQAKKDAASGRTTAADMRREDKMREMTQGVRSIENLQNQLRDPDVRAGLQAKAAPLLEKIGSLANAEFETAVNNALTGTDKTTLFLKDALLETYAIERAAKGGQRLTVQDMKMVGPVLDPTNYSADTYNALLDSRRKVLYNNLQDMGMKPEEIKEKSAQKPYEPYAGEQVPTVTTQEQYNALFPGAYYLEDGVRYQKPGRK
jgi:hypothetical protein